MTSGPEWTAIILAGRRPGEDAFALSNGVLTKALIRVGGEPMLGRVVRTVLAAPSISRAVILAQEPNELLEGELAWIGDDPRISTAPSGDGISGSVSNIAGSDRAPWPALVVTADHALLTPAMIEEFIAGTPGADAAAAVVERRTLEAAYPESRRTWLRFSDGDYTGANLFALRGPKSKRALEEWARVEQDRKKALRLIRRFGFFLALRAATRTITLDGTLSKVAGRLGTALRAVRLSTPEAAIDVDKAEDLKLAERIVAGRG